MKRFTFDTETTGVEGGSRLLEIYSALLNEDGSICGQFHDLIDPKMPIPSDASGVHGLDDAAIKGSRTADAVLADWLAWIETFGAQCGIAHYAPFDVGIISCELQRAKLPMPDVLVIDTCEMAKAIKATKKNSLDHLVEHYGIARRGIAHRAGSDAMACRDYWLIASKLLPDYVAHPWKADHWHPAELPAHLAELPKAIAYGDAFRFEYEDAQGNRTQREITPYGYSQNEKGIYFHGLCHMRNERRTFLADRVVIQ